MVELSCQGDFGKTGEYNQSFGGDTYNTAVALARLGSSVSYLTRFGQDPFAHLLKLELKQEKIDCKHVKTVTGPTGMYLASVNRTGERQFVYYRKGSAASTLGEEDIDPARIKAATAVFSSGITLALSPSSRKAVLKAFQTARANQVCTVFDPNFRPTLWKNQTEAFEIMDELLPWVDIMLPSIPEDTQKLLGVSRPDQVIEYYWMKGVKLIAVKAGKHGCYLGYKKKIQHIPAMPGVKVVDTTGAGDAFNAGFIHGFATQQSLVDCARLGLITAGLKIENQGSAKAMPYQQAVYQKAFLNKR